MSPRDPRAAAVAILLLAFAGLMASTSPAVRALRIEPATALSADWACLSQGWSE